MCIQIRIVLNYNVLDKKFTSFTSTPKLKTENKVLLCWINLTHMRPTADHGYSLGTKCGGLCHNCAHPNAGLSLYLKVQNSLRNILSI